MRLAPDLRLTLALGVVLVYWGTMVVIAPSLPERLSRDTLLIYEMLATGIEQDLSGSYAGTVFLFSLFPSNSLQFAVAALGSLFLVLFVYPIRTVRWQLIGILLLIPVVVLSLLRPQKEFFVILMTLIVYLSALRSSGWRTGFFFTILLLYGGYALLVREYFGLILVLFIGLNIFVEAPRAIRASLLLFLLLLILVAPTTLFDAVQSHRDWVNEHRADASLVGNRTAFNNPFEPSGKLSFFVNYAYAALFLNFAVFFLQSIKEVFLLVTVSIYGFLVYHGLRLGSRMERSFACLFLAHALTLWLFEPDLGSYLRHLSSALLYLLPVIVARERYVAMREWAKCPSVLRDDQRPLVVQQGGEGERR
jgi:hypothetical protein